MLNIWHKRGSRSLPLSPCFLYLTCRGTERYAIQFRSGGFTMLNIFRKVFFFFFQEGFYPNTSLLSNIVPTHTHTGTDTHTHTQRYTHTHRFPKDPSSSFLCCNVTTHCEHIKKGLLNPWQELSSNSRAHTPEVHKCSSEIWKEVIGLFPGWNHGGCRREEKEGSCCARNP